MEPCSVLLKYVVPKEIRREAKESQEPDFQEPWVLS